MILLVPERIVFCVYDISTPGRIKHNCCKLEVHADEPYQDSAADIGLEIFHKNVLDELIANFDWKTKLQMQTVGSKPHSLQAAYNDVATGILWKSICWWFAQEAKWQLLFWAAKPNFELCQLPLKTSIPDYSLTFFIAPFDKPWISLSYRLICRCEIFGIQQTFTICWWRTRQNSLLGYASIKIHADRISHIFWANTIISSILLSNRSRPSCT